jgi:hypothetical protein
MAQDFDTAAEERGAGSFKEAVCIDAMRIYDSCCEGECSGCQKKGGKKISRRNSFGLAPFSLL